MTPLRAIRKVCIACVGNAYEVKDCGAMLVWEFKVTKKEYATSSPFGSRRDDLL